MADNPFRKQENPFAARRTAQQSVASVPTANAFGSAALNTFLNNFMGLPAGAGDLLATAAAGVGAGVAKVRGEPGNFRERLEAEQQRLPASALRAIPRPTVQDIAAGVRSLPAFMPGGQSPGEAFRGSQEDIAAEEAAVREENPLAVGAGEVAGDIATLLSGRAPAARGINRAETAFTTGKFTQSLPTATKHALDNWLLAPTMRRMIRGTGRAAETGFEAMVLDVMKGDDPLETAAFAAGGQLGGSLFLTAGRKLLSGGPLAAGVKLGMAALATGSLLQVLKTATPGGRNRILESVESGYDKVAIALALGAASSMVGAGRLRGGRNAELFPKLMDAISTTPRAGVLSILEDWLDKTEDEQVRAERVLGLLTENPEAFGQSGQRRLMRAMGNGTLFAEIDKLMENREFREQLD